MDPSAARQSRSVLIAGGGIAGLVAALDFVDAGWAVELIEESPAPGGLIASAEVAGHRVDVGAESMLATRPEGLELVGRVGLVDQVVAPAMAAAAIYSRGERHPVPPATILGVPTDPRAAAGLLTPAEVERAIREEPWPGGAVTGDVSVGDYVASRLGPAVVDRLVDPLVGGVYAGSPWEMSLRATNPRVWDRATSGESLLAPPPAVPATQTGSPFAGLIGGLTGLIAAIERTLTSAGVTVRASTSVAAMRRLDGGFEVDLRGDGAGPSRRVDAVIVATPVAQAASLLAGVAPDAAAELGALQSASVTVATLAFPSGDLGPLPGSGVLIPAVEPLAIKASTFSSNKWGWVAELEPGVTYLRTSLGRAGDEHTPTLSDDLVIEASLADLGTVLGRAMPRPLAWHVQRWPRALPQYRPGHVDAVDRIRRSVASVPGLALAGSYLDGVGIPAVIASAHRAAADIGAGPN